MTHKTLKAGAKSGKPRHTLLSMLCFDEFVHGMDIIGMDPLFFDKDSIAYKLVEVTPVVEKICEKQFLLK